MRKWSLVLLLIGMAACDRVWFGDMAVDRTTAAGRSPTPAQVFLADELAPMQAPEYIEESPGPVSESLRVALLLPMTGKHKSIGEAFSNMAVLAAADVGSSNLILQLYYTKGEPREAAVQARKAKDEGVGLILGPLLAEETKAVAKVAGGTPVVAFTSDPKVLGGRVGTLALLVTEQVDEVVTYACGRGRGRLAVFGRDNELGALMLKTAEAAMKRCGGEVTVVKLYANSGQDLMPAVKEALGRRAVVADKLKARAKNRDAYADEKLPDSPKSIPLQFDAVLMADDGSALRALASALAYYDLEPPEVQVLGTTAVATFGETAFNRVWYAGFSRSGYNALAARYKESYGVSPPRIATQAYDVVALAAALAVRRVGLYDSNGFSGSEGAFRLSPSGFNSTCWRS